MDSERMCVGCRKMKPKNGLIRLVKKDKNTIEIDLTYKSQGRGAYVCRDPKCAAAARKSKAFERSFSCRVCADVYVELEAAVADAER